MYNSTYAPLAQRTEQESSKFLVAGSTPARGALDNKDPNGKIEYMYKYDEEREETIRKFKKTEPKPKKPKSDHKHEYERCTEKRDDVWTVSEKYAYQTYFKCKVCGRVK